MSSANAEQSPDKFTIAVFGKKPDLIKIIGETILANSSGFVQDQHSKVQHFVLGESDKFRIISIPDFFNEDCDHPDQQIIDFMARFDPGPHQFILAVGSENTEVEDVMVQITKLQLDFGQNVTEYLVIVTENFNSYQSLSQKVSKIKLVTLNEKLSAECMEWCHKHQSFKYDYKNYSENVVKRRKKHLSCSDDNSSSKNHSPQTKPGTMDDDNGPSETVLNIVLLGRSGTGKSASANTILAAGKQQRSQGQYFKSKPNSTPVTTECKDKVVQMSVKQVRVVDTPDFFYEDEPVKEEQLERCKQYCKPGICVVLLVMQLGRFTEGERGILENLENKLGWKIREKTIILFTHGEDMKGEVDKFIGERSHLKHIVEACGDRYHVFKNTSKDSKQVVELIEKFPGMFPNITAKQSSLQCCLC